MEETQSGGIKFGGTYPVAPNYAPFRQKSLGDCTRPRSFGVFRSVYARARCEGAMRTGAFEGDGDEGQTICNYFNTRLDVRVRPLCVHKRAMYVSAMN